MILVGQYWAGGATDPGEAAGIERLRYRATGVKRSNSQERRKLVLFCCSSTRAGVPNDRLSDWLRGNFPPRDEPGLANGPANR